MRDIYFTKGSSPACHSLSISVDAYLMNQNILVTFLTESCLGFVPVDPLNNNESKFSLFVRCLCNYMASSMFSYLNLYCLCM